MQLFEDHMYNFFVTLLPSLAILNVFIKYYFLIFSAHVVRVTENYENARNKYIVFYLFNVTEKQYSSTVTPVAQ